MKDLLKEEFISHYNRNPDLPCEVTIVHQTTEETHFEYEDKKGGGCAKYDNPHRLFVHIVDYEGFFTSLPPRIKNTIKSIGTEICDLIVYSDNNQYFLLNELTNTRPEFITPFTNLKGQQEGKESKARKQLRQSLEYLIRVPAIEKFIQQFSTKHCCFFSNYPYSPQQTDTNRKINAIEAFNPFLLKNGSYLEDKNIEHFGFEFWTFSGNQTYSL